VCVYTIHIYIHIYTIFSFHNVEQYFLGKDGGKCWNLPVFSVTTKPILLDSPKFLP
jgi:hypothetical protein